MAESDGRLPSETVPFQTVQIIVAALISGTLIFAVIAIFTAQPGNLDLVAYLAVGFSAVELAISFVVPKIVTRKAMQELPSENGEIPAMALFGVYQTQAIIHGALLEGPAFFCCIAYMNTQLWWTLATALGLMAILAILFPTRGRFDDWVREQRELRSLDAPPDASRAT
jgi:hypothetical protein